MDKLERWGSLVSSQLEAYLKQNKYNAVFTPLNSSTMVFYQSSVYVLIKLNVEDQIELRLVVINLKSLSTGAFKPDSLNSISVKIHNQNIPEKLRLAQHINSKIQIKINPRDPSVWMLTIVSGRCPNQQTRIYITKYLDLQTELPTQIVFRQVNLRYTEINKVDWCPMSTDHLVVLYKKPYVDVVNYIKNFNFADLEIDLSLISNEMSQIVEFSDFQFCAGILEYTFYLFLLADNGEVHCVHPLVIDQVLIEEQRLLSFKKSTYPFVSIIDTFVQYKKQQQGKTRILCDYNQMIPNLRSQVISNRSSVSRSNKYLNLKILPLDHLVLMVSKVTGPQFVFSLECWMVVKNDYERKNVQAYKIAELQLPAKYSPHLIQQLSSPYPQFISTLIPDNSICILSLNSIYRLELSRLREFDRKLDFDLLLQPLIKADILVTDTDNSLAVSDQVGFYSVLLIENLVLILRGQPTCVLQAHYIHSELCTKGLDSIRDQFSLLFKQKYNDHKASLNASSTKFISKNLVANDFPTLLKDIEDFHCSQKQRLKSKQIQVHQLRVKHKQLRNSYSKIFQQKEAFNNRLQAIRNKNEELMSSRARASQLDSTNPRKQLLDQTITQMGEQFEVARHLTTHAIKELESVDPHLDIHVITLKENLEKLGKIRQDLDEVSSQI